jgi:tight adherence protein C
MEIGLVAAVLCGLAGVGVLAAGARESGRDRRRRAGAYLEEIIVGGLAEDEADEFSRQLARPFVDRVARPLVARMAGIVGSITPRDHRARVRDRLGRAGMDARVRPEDVIAAQGGGFLLGLLLGLGVLVSDRLGPVTALAVVVVLAVAGAAAPLAWLTRKVERRTSGIRRDLPETLDLLAISVEAGLGLEGAMEVVVEQDPGPLGRELSRTLQEMELGLSRRDALVNLKQRAQVTELSTFVQALVQADILGMPLARVLKIQADEMRLKRRQWARERAAKLPVKILFPLVACIFPAILVVILGPAISQIGNAF